MTRTTFLALGVLPLVAAGPAHSAEHAVGPTVITFDGAELGRPPNGFTTALTGRGGPVSWLVQENPTAPSGSRVLVQTSADTTGSRFPLCVYHGVSTADGTFSVAFKPMSGTVDQAGGLVWRYQSASNYYLVRANALEGNVVLYKVENGRRSDLKPIGSGFLAYGKKAGVVRDRWQTLKIEVRSSRFSVFLDGEHLFDVEDSTFRAPGKIGLWTKADSVTAFDDFTIAPAASLDASPAPLPRTPPEVP